MIRDLKNVSPRTRWMLRQLGVYTLIFLSLLVVGLIIARSSFARAEKMFNERLEQMEADLKADYEAELAARDAVPFSVENVRAEQAELIAKVLYGVKGNNSTDLRTLCWCIFNRVDNPLYPNDIAGVVDQPSQWMGYSSENPVLEELYEIARGELDMYLDGSRRPCDSSYVFMDWSSSSITLRDEFTISKSTTYWRIK